MAYAPFKHESHFWLCDACGSQNHVIVPFTERGLLA